MSVSNAQSKLESGSRTVSAEDERLSKESVKDKSRKYFRDFSNLHSEKNREKARKRVDRRREPPTKKEEAELARMLRRSNRIANLVQDIKDKDGDDFGYDVFVK